LAFCLFPTLVVVIRKSYRKSQFVATGNFRHRNTGIIREEIMKIQVRDIAIEYDLDGPEEAPVLMLHHSLATSGMIWEELNIALAQYYRVLRFDARGHGLSDAPVGPYSFEQLVGDATGLMEALNIEKAYHVGLSMGGMVSQCLGFMAPERVAGLILVSTTSDLPEEARSAWDKRLASVRSAGIEPLVEATIKRWFTKDFRDGGDSVIGETADLIRNTPVEGYCGWGAAIRDIHLTPRLGEITAPTLGMVGANDPGTPVAMSQTIQQAIPGAKLQVFENVSHMLPLQQPDRFIESLIDFIEDQDETEA
jgi:3-oxoadipate enol-lactonase